MSHLFRHLTDPAPAANAIRATFAMHGDAVAAAAGTYARTIDKAAAVLLDTLDGLANLNLRGEVGEISATDVRDDLDVIGAVMTDTLAAASDFADALAACLDEGAGK